MPSLAIVVPAYKDAYLFRTLQSLALQTCQDFTVYIGNDSGGAGIEPIVYAFKDRLNIHYTCFENNIGGSSLVKQWNRCIAHTQEEEWIWLLPDDDYADPGCVALFYSSLTKHNFDLFRFNVRFVTAEEEVFKTNAPLPDVQPAFDSLMEKLSFYRSCTVAEFIFNRAKFESIGFADIPMAWGTDDLLWYSMGAEKGIYGCNDAYVYLRQSSLNISNDYGPIGKEKIAANFIFFELLLQNENFATDLKNIENRQRFTLLAALHIVNNLQGFSLQLDFSSMWKYSVKANRIWGGGVIRNMRRFWLNNKRIAYQRKLPNE